MRRIFTLTITCLFCTLSSQAVLKTWVGATGAAWSIGTNWSPGGAPLTADDVQFTGIALVTLDVNPNINSLLVSAAGVVEFTAAASRNITLTSSSAITPGLKINAGATLKLTQTGASPLNLSLTGGISVTGQVYGTLQFIGTNASAAARLELFTGPLANGNMVVYDGGIIQYDINTGNTVGNGLAGLQMEAGSQYIVNRNGGTLPAGNYKNGSYIRIKGVVANMFLFNTTAAYQGVIEWDCASQTVNGPAATLSLSSAYPTIDSFVVKSTGGTGTLRLATEMSTSPSINYLLVSGGVLEVASPRSAGRTMVINNNLEVSGGTLYINATDATDNLTSYNMTITVNGNTSVSGTGTLNMSNRPNGSSSTYGTGNIIALGNFLQTGGLITETAPLPPISDASGINMNGAVAQNLSLTNWNNQVRLVVANTSGVNLQSNITCPEFLLMNTPGAYIVLGNFHLTTAYNRYSISSSGANPARLVTNGTGHFALTGVASGSTVTFPVTPVVNSISSVILKNNDITANTFDVRVERGNNPFGIYNTGLTVNRTWIINDATDINSFQADLTFLYPDTAINALCNRSGVMELGHFPVSAWSVDPVGITRTPSQGPGVNTIDTTGVFSPASLDSAFVLGNEFSILTLSKGIAINYFKGNKQAGSNVLNWAVNCTSNQAIFEIQRSNNGISFTTIGNITASYTRCLQPFDFTDNNPQAGISYYRIKITDIDGRVTYSTMVLLQHKNFAAGTIALLPTLVSKPLAILYLDAAKAGQVLVSITDANGRMVQSSKQAVNAGQNQLTMNFEQLKPGAYFMSALGSNQKWTTVRFVKL
jgi:hypothetical protein